jgi:hypothetical protein
VDCYCVDILLCIISFRGFRWIIIVWIFYCALFLYEVSGVMDSTAYSGVSTAVPGQIFQLYDVYIPMIPM